MNALLGKADEILHRTLHPALKAAENFFGCSSQTLGMVLLNLGMLAFVYTHMLPVVAWGEPKTIPMLLTFMYVSNWVNDRRLLKSNPARRQGDVVTVDTEISTSDRELYVRRTSTLLVTIIVWLGAGPSITGSPDMVKAAFSYSGTILYWNLSLIGLHAASRGEGGKKPWVRRMVETLNLGRQLAPVPARNN